MRRKKKQMPKIDYGELIIHYCDNLTIAMDRAMVTPKDLARLADVPTLRIKKYMTGKALPTSGEYDKIGVVLGLTELNRADYCYEYDTKKLRK